MLTNGEDYFSPFSIYEWFLGTECCQGLCELPGTLPPLTPVPGHTWCPPLGTLSSSARLGLLSHRNYEIRNACCFELLSWC